MKNLEGSSEGSSMKDAEEPSEIEYSFVKISSEKVFGIALPLLQGSLAVCYNASWLWLTICEGHSLLA